MPTEIRFLDRPDRSLWVSQHPRDGYMYQVQDGAWYSDRFRATHDQALGIATQIVAALELRSEDGAAALRMRWTNGDLVIEYESENRGWREIADFMSVLESMNGEQPS